MCHLLAPCAAQGAGTAHPVERLSQGALAFFRKVGAFRPLQRTSFRGQRWWWYQRLATYLPREWRNPFAIACTPQSSCVFLGSPKEISTPVFDGTATVLPHLKPQTAGPFGTYVFVTTSLNDECSSAGYAGANPPPDQTVSSKIDVLQVSRPNCSSCMRSRGLPLMEPATASLLPPGAPWPLRTCCWRSA